MTRTAVFVILSLFLSGCANLYHHIDEGPNGNATTFRGIEDYLKGENPLLVVQVHGMGDHSLESDCGTDPALPSRNGRKPGTDKKPENLALQDRIAKKLRYVPSGEYPPLIGEPIILRGTERAGTYSVSKFVDPSGTRAPLFFSCITWGETSRTIKQGLLELDGHFLEKNENEAHRALLNRKAKQFVNQSFSDPVIYVGGMGPYIREVVWEGIMLSLRSHARKERQAKGSNSYAAFFTPDGVRNQLPIAIISDSLGSRIVFDTLNAKIEFRPSIADEAIAAEALETKAAADAALAKNLLYSVGSVYMLANQLPLLELAYMKPPQAGTTLENMAYQSTECYWPLLETSAIQVRASKPGRIEVIAFTDVNDALSYRLSDRFKARCGDRNSAGSLAGKGRDIAPEEAHPPLDFVNVTLPNARLRWLFVYSHLPKAHSSGFKNNKRAIEYMAWGTSHDGK